jgi:thioredoxin 1
MIQLIYFTASWCGPCRTFGPLLAATGHQIERVDIDLDPDGAAQTHGVLSVPTVIVLRDGEGRRPLRRAQRVGAAGAASKDRLISRVRSASRFTTQ